MSILTPSQLAKVKRFQEGGEAAVAKAFSASNKAWTRLQGCCSLARKSSPASRPVLSSG